MEKRDLPTSDRAQALERALASAREDPAELVERTMALNGDEPTDPRARRLLARAFRRVGRHAEAGRAEAEAIRLSANSAPLLDAARAMRRQDVAGAEQILRAYLEADPDDPQALRMLAEIAAVCGHGDEAERLLRRALAAAPGFVPLYVNLAGLLQDLERTGEALGLLDQVLANDPANTLALSVKAGILGGAGLTPEALAVQEQLLAIAPQMSNFWTNYAHMLKALGRPEDAEAAYRNALRLDPASGLAWWGLASSRIVTMDERDIAVIRRELAGRPDELNRMQLHFALGKALGDRQRFEESFGHYVAANALRSVLIPYDPRQIEETAQKAQRLFTSDFLQRFSGHGSQSAGPIFIVGMPRSGSTLVEQILASHPAVEGLGELFDLDRIVAGLLPPGGGASSWLDAVAGLDAPEVRALGERYASSANARRKTDRPFFTDKMPSNWLYAGLIQMILPNARVIDVRRRPIACCFSNFTLYFNRLTNFGSSLEDIGRYYSLYEQMMAHLDRLRPGRIHRLHYEDLVRDPEGEIRRLLDHLGLPFDEACLRFHENPREVHTPSAQQVRRPISNEGLEYWRNYEPWLGPLKVALGFGRGEYSAPDVA